MKSLSVLSLESVCVSADFRGVIRFGVVTSKQVAEAISLKEDQTVFLYRRLNSSLVSKEAVIDGRVNTGWGNANKCWKTFKS